MKEEKRKKKIKWEEEKSKRITEMKENKEKE